jgi:hypothetical protein
MLAAALLTDAALGRQGRPAHDVIQPSPHHRTNKRPTPAPCHAAVVVSADIDFLRCRNGRQCVRLPSSNCIHISSPWLQPE